MDQLVEWQKAQRGELYHAFGPELIAVRSRCARACHRFNTAEDMSRHRMVELWRDITQDNFRLPPPAPTQEEDDQLFEEDPWVDRPIRADYGVNIHLGPKAFLNFNAVFVDTCPVYIGARSLIGPNCSFYSGGHPLDPAVRNGLKGPEFGKDIRIGDDCWLGGNVTILPGITIGRGSTIGAGSVVTKDVPPFHVAAGNPARILRRIETSMDPTQREGISSQDVAQGAEPLIAEQN